MLVYVLQQRLGLWGDGEVASRVYWGCRCSEAILVNKSCTCHTHDILRTSSHQTMRRNVGLFKLEGYRANNNCEVDSLVKLARICRCHNVLLKITQ